MSAKMDYPRSVRLVACILTLGTLGGCVPCLPDAQVNTPAPVIDFARAHQLARALFDVSLTTDITDEQLGTMYQTTSNQVLVRSTVFAGDTSPSRYMFIKDPVAQTQTIYLSGTNSSTLWSFDLDLAMVREPDFHSLVHRGFNNAALTVLDDVLPRLETNYPTSVAGYSIGGAMAVLLSQYLVVNGYQVVEVTTFGQPKITDAAGVENFTNLPLLRFVNRKDPVPHMPPDGIGAVNLVHFGPEVVLYDTPVFTYLVPGDPSYESSTDGSIAWIIARANFNEHGLIYVDRLATLVENAPAQIPLACQSSGSP
jgi:hypothetical protein